MITIVAHHYVVNSGLLDCIEKQAPLEFKDYFLILFGMGGKTGINLLCFNHRVLYVHLEYYEKENL